MKENLQSSAPTLQRLKWLPARGWVGCLVLHAGGRVILPLVLATRLSSRLFAQSATGPLPPLAPAYGEMQPTFWELHGTAILVAGAVFIVLAGLICWLIFRSKPAPIVPPVVAARAALTRLLGQPETGNVLSETSQILRRYIAVVFQFPPGELTTAEFSAALAGNPKIEAELAETVSRFLRECDQRKFSPAGSTAPLQAAATALKLVDQAERRAVQNTGPGMVKA